MVISIREAREADAVHLPRIEAACEVQFHTAGVKIPPIGTDPDFVPDVYVEACRQGRVFVAVDPADVPIGFALVEPLDGEAHLVELDVLPAHQGRGVGSALIEAVCGWSRAHGFGALTLTTFREVPWNGPYYLRRGFVEVPVAALSPALARIMSQQADRGLDPDERCVMRRVL